LDSECGWFVLFSKAYDESEKKENNDKKEALKKWNQVMIKRNH
jgi:hypothetical protein